MLHILLVEDDADLADLLAECLRLLGHAATAACSLAQARELAPVGFDLLISDLDLPDGSGLDLARTLGLPGIILSGSGEPRDVARSREAGFADFLSKPVSLERLDAAVRRFDMPARIAS